MQTFKQQYGPSDHVYRKEIVELADVGTNSYKTNRNELSLRWSERYESSWSGTHVPALFLVLGECQCQVVILNILYVF